MRALGAGLIVAAVTLAGCLGGDNVEQQSISTETAISLPAGLSIHVGEKAVVRDVATVLGSAPKMVERLLGNRGGEPTLGVTESGAIFVASGDMVMRSRDGGATWEKVFEFGPVRLPVAAPVVGSDPVRNFDPMLWVDRETNMIWNAPMYPPLVCSYGTMSTDDGETWFEHPAQCGFEPPMDHQKIAIGPPAAGGLQPTGSYSKILYYCWNQLIATKCSVSTDGGLTFLRTVTIADSTQCGGINGSPAPAPDGTVYVPLGRNCGKPAVAVSRDNGQTWKVNILDDGGLGNEEIDPDITVTPDGTAYYVYRAKADHRIYLLRSTDGFETVQGPFLVSPPDVTSTNFVAIASGDDGRIAVAYLGTRDTDANAGRAEPETKWYLFATFSFDAAEAQPTFVTTQISAPENPVQIGYIWQGGGGDPGRNMLDFIDAVVGPDGRFVVAFTDGCTADCDGNPEATQGNSRARDTAIAILESGPSLYAARGLLDALGIGTSPAGR
ncbi:MAG TPA: sialidase family protein [Candidatus Thermoplasmatota archaeon]|nr:sialidase family protein [Candidatus Thermoplasmatota archaeon]